MRSCEILTPDRELPYALKMIQPSNKYIMRRIDSEARSVLCSLPRSIGILITDNEGQGIPC